MTTQAQVVRKTRTCDWQSFVGLNSGVMYVDCHDNLTVYNELAAELLDANLEVGKTGPIHECFPDDREEGALLHHIAMDQLERTNQLVTFTGQGGIRHILLDTYKDVDDLGDVQGMYIVMRDLSDFEVMEGHIQRTDKLATVGKVAAGVAHEIRNPLTTVKGFLQVMTHRFTVRNQAEELEFSHMMLAEIDKVDGLVNELLLLSKPRNFNRRKVQLAEVIQEAWSEITTECESRGIEAQCILEEVPEISGEPDMLRHVLNQLVENAIDAMDRSGKLTVHLRKTASGLQLDVHDTGPGIPYYQMDKVFDAFFTTKEKGTGLGLPICQRIVADHGGEIRVSSKGFGTTFSVQLPTL